MYAVSEAYTNAAEANARQILVRALLNGEVELGGEHIVGGTVVEAVGTSNGLSMGNCIASKLTMSLRTPEMPLVLKGGTVIPRVGFYGVYTDSAKVTSGGVYVSAATPTVDESGILIFGAAPTVDESGVLTLSGGEAVQEYCPLGTFYITKAVSKDDFEGVIEIEAYDGFSKTEEAYTPTINMPNTAETILYDIAQQCGFELSEDIEFPAGEFMLYEWTCREYIGCFAGLVGKNARFDRDGLLSFVWYADTGRTVGRNLQYLGGMKRLTSNMFTARSITSGSAEDPIVAGSGVGISFENPLMTQETLDEIASALLPLSYTPASLKWRGNPAIECGDVVTAIDRSGNAHTVYVMEQTLRFGGGFHSEIRCYGASEAEIRFSTSPQSKKIRQVYTRLQESIKSATELLNGTNGGVFEITDTNGDGVNDGWIIHSADSSQHVRAMAEGIGITTDGGATYRQAITAQGINADAITVGQMNAQRISVGDASLGDVFEVTTEDGETVVTIGSSKSDIKQRQTNSAITFVDGTDAEVAKFSPSGAEWTDMQQIKYCGFIWTRSALTGNVRFTKVKGG